MKVKEAIEQLKNMPQEATLWHLWDGEPRTAINVIYESNSGKVITADYDQVCYSDLAMPKGTPQQNKFWYTEKNPRGYTEEDDF